MTTHIEMDVPCRQCESCLNYRSYSWASRMVTEWKGSQRTWMGTWTLNPEARLSTLNRARNALETQGLALSRFTEPGRSTPAPTADFDVLTEVEKFRLWAAEVGGLATLALKTLRTGRLGPDPGDAKAGSNFLRDASDVETWEYPPTQFRYCLVAEAHKDGTPHLHLYVHELPGSRPITWRMLTQPAVWPHGYAEWHLVESKRDATYASKYIAKSGLARVRASIRYGTTGNTPASAIASEVTERA